jgi:hypothetical protein
MSTFFANYPGGGTGSGGGGMGNGVFIDTFTLTPTDISNAGVILSHAPTQPTKTIVLVDQAPNQAYTIDYVISSRLSAGATLDWQSLGLQGELSAGDVLEVVYY